MIDDQVTGLGLKEHDIRLYFNFAFGNLQKEGKGKFVYTSQKGRRYEFISQATKETEFEILEGSEEPIGGWISYGYAWKKPIPQLAVKTKGPVPVRFLTIIRPEGGKTEGHVTETEVQLSLENGKTLTLGTDKITW